MMCPTRRLIVAFLGSTIVFCQAQAQGQPTSQRMLAALRQAIPMAALQPTQRIQLVVPGQVLLAASQSQFEIFNRVPLTGDGAFLPRREDVLSQLKVLDSNVEISPLSLSSDQRQSLLEARRLLYIDALQVLKTRDYERYLEYEGKYVKLKSSLDAASSPAERSSLQQQVAIARQDWDTYGNRAVISQALDTVARYGEDKSKQLREDWSKSLTPEGIGDFSQFWQIFSSTTDWISISISSQLLDPSQSFSVTTSSGTTQLPPRSITQISFQYRFYKIPRRSLTHPFLQTRNWRNSKSYVLSDGLAADSPSELLPRVVTSLLVVKNLEIIFEPSSSWQLVDQALAKDPTVTLSGLALKSQNKTVAVSLPNYLLVATPFIAGAVVSDVPQIPATGPSDSWPLWWIPR